MYDREGAWHRVHIRFVWFVLTMQDSCWWRAEGEWPHAGSNGNLEKTIKESKANQQEKNESNPSSSSPPTIILFNCISALFVELCFRWILTLNDHEFGKIMENTLNVSHSGSSKGKWSTDRGNPAQRQARSGSYSPGSGTVSDSSHQSQTQKRHLEGFLNKYTNLLQGWQNR